MKAHVSSILPGVRDMDRSKRFWRLLVRRGCGPNNGETGGPLGGQERVYFASPDGHPIEVTAGELSV
jgi:hypothetical protein